MSERQMRVHMTEDCLFRNYVEERLAPGKDRLAPGSEPGVHFSTDVRKKKKPVA